MVMPPDPSELPRKIAELCSLLDDADALRQRQRIQAEIDRVLDLLRSGADPAELEDAFDDLDRELRVAGRANGLHGQSRGPGTSGFRPHRKVAVCPGPVLCSRIEPASDLRPSPPCRINGGRMRKTRLNPPS